MSDFNALKFVADNAGLNIFKALEKAYEQGKEDAAPKWIPITEKAPEEGQEILATEEPNGWYDVVIIRTYYAKLHRKEVLAWMPLPEPWKGEEHE